MRREVDCSGKHIEETSNTNWGLNRKALAWTSDSVLDPLTHFPRPHEMSPAVGRYPRVSHTLLFALAPLHLVQISLHVTHHIVKWLVFVYIYFPLTDLSS